MSDHVTPNECTDGVGELDQDPAERLTRLIEILRSAAREMATSDRAWERGAIAAKWLEFEIAPLVEAIDVAAIISEIGQDAIDAYLDRSTRREVMPIDSHVAILPGQRAEIVARPQRGAMVVDRIVIPDAIADRFLIHEIRVGNRPQIMPTPIPASEFRSASPYGPIVIETVQTAMDLAITVEYIGTVVEGERFYGTVMGRSADDRPLRPQRFDPIPLGDGRSFPATQSIEQIGPQTPEQRELMQHWTRIIGATDGAIPEPYIYEDSGPIEVDDDD